MKLATVGFLTTSALAQCTEKSTELSNAVVTESVTYHPTSKYFFAGNVFSPNINRAKVNNDGSMGTTDVLPNLTDGPGTAGVFVKVNKLYAGWNDANTVFNTTNPDTAGKVIVFDINSEGALTKAFEADLTALTGDRKIFVNDVWVGLGDKIYATGSTSGKIYQISSDGTTLLKELESPKWTPNPNPMNGLMLGPNGIEGFVAGSGTEYLLIGRSLFTGDTLLRVKSDLTGDVAPVQITLKSGITMVNNGIDGLRFLPDGRLAAVMYDAVYKPRVVVMESDNDWMNATMTYVSEPSSHPDHLFTTLTNGPDGLYVVDTTFSFPQTQGFYIQNICVPAAPTAAPTAAPPLNAPSSTTAPTFTILAAAAAAALFFF